MFSFRDVARGSSRRGFLARLGTGLIGATLITAAKPPEKALAVCGGCGSCADGSTNCGCCPSCQAIDGHWCDTYTGDPNAVDGNCPFGWEIGWTWYCCTNGQRYTCRDCCFFSSFTGTVRCTTRPVNGTGSC